MGDRLNYVHCIRSVGRPITYYPEIAKAFGSVKCGVFLSNFLFWEGKQEDDEGWIYKSQKSINDETGLTRTEQESARKKLKELGVLKEKKEGVPARLFYLFDWSLVDYRIQNHLDGKPKKKTPDKTILFQMKELFDNYYMTISEGVEFEWGKDRKHSGKHWSGLKKIKDFFLPRTAKRLSKEESEVTDEELLSGFSLFLEKIPEYWMNRCTTPMLMYSNINQIITDIINNNKNASRNQKKSGNNTGSTASEYIS